MKWIKEDSDYLPSDEDYMDNLLSFDETNSQSLMFSYKVMVERGANNLIPLRAHF